MSEHRIYIETVVAEDLLELPKDIYILGAEVEDGNLILSVSSKDDLGSADVNALYGNRDEDEKRVHFGMFETR